MLWGVFLKHIFYWCYYEILSWDKLIFCSKFSVKAFWMIQIDRIVLCSKELQLFHIDKKELLIKLVRNWKGTFKVMKFYFSLVMILWNFRVSNKSSCSSPLRLTVTNLFYMTAPFACTAVRCVLGFVGVNNQEDLAEQQCRWGRTYM